jgi:glycerol-3-phosphate acyltransferase PlsY
METLDIIILILGSIFSYLLGGISIARLITKKKQDGNIINQGSGNPGTMNMMRTHGVFMGVFTLLCDALKGFLPALFGSLYFDGYNGGLKYIALFLFGLCAVLGHIYPIYYKFKGGKGIATTIGVFAVADPLTSGVLFLIMFVTLYFIKIGSVVSLLYIVIQATVQMFREYSDGNWIMYIIMWVMIFIDILAHRKNLERLVENKENPADLQEGLQKDIQKLREKKQAKLEKNKQKHEKIKEKYERKITDKHNKVNKKLEKMGSASSDVVAQDEQNN